jgi:ribose/xylose/arabinose/galactoside ABC-type transport system permease subunit
MTSRVLIRASGLFIAAALIAGTSSRGLEGWIAPLLVFFAVLGFVITRVLWRRLASWQPKSRWWIPGAILLSTVAVNTVTRKADLVLFPLLVGLLYAMLWERTRRECADTSSSSP